MKKYFIALIVLSCFLINVAEVSAQEQTSPTLDPQKLKRNQMQLLNEATKSSEVNSSILAIQNLNIIIGRLKAISSRLDNIAIRIETRLGKIKLNKTYLKRFQTRIQEIKDKNIILKSELDKHILDMESVKQSSNVNGEYIKIKPKISKFILSLEQLYNLETKIVVDLKKYDTK